MITDFKDAFNTLNAALKAEAEIHFIGRKAHIRSCAFNRETYDLDPSNVLSEFHDELVPITELLEIALSLLDGCISDDSPCQDTFGPSSDEHEAAYNDLLARLRTRYHHINTIKSRLLRRTTKDDQVFFRLLLAGDRHLPSPYLRPPVPDGTLLDTFNYDVLGKIETIEETKRQEPRGYWEKYAAWCQELVEQPNPYSPSYYCETYADVCYAVFDYLVEQKLNLRECKQCGHLFIPEYQPKERYCSEECRLASMAVRVAIKRTDPLYRKIESIKQLLKRRTLSDDPDRRDAAEDNLSSFEEELRSKKLELADGVITKDEMENFLTSYHTELKKTYQHKPRKRKTS